MKTKIPTKLFFGMLSLVSVTSVFSSAQAGGVSIIIDRRCDGWGDSVDQIQVEGRYKWAMSCETDPDMQDQIEVAYIKGVTDVNKNVTKGYPTYGRYNRDLKEYENPEKWFAPLDASAPCTRPSRYIAFAFCASGCYTPEQYVLFPTGEVEIKNASDKNLKVVRTLATSSTLENLTYKDSPISEFVMDIKDSEHDVLVFEMLSGRSLSVTPNHPLVNEDGKVLPAEKFLKGQALISSNGNLDPIMNITSQKYFGKVYNLDVESNDLKEHILVAQGYLNGSVRYQNQFVRHLNRILLRTNIAEDLLAKN